MLNNYSYRGFVIKQQPYYRGSFNYKVFKNNRLFSIMYFANTKAAAKAIDVMLKIGRNDAKEEVYLINEEHNIQSKPCKCGCGESFDFIKYSKKKFIDGHNTTTKYRKKFKI
jgi:hypothetical protein